VLFGQQLTVDKAALDDVRNWLTWACGPRNAMKIAAAQ
jgi:hypothetical protein